MGQVAPEFYLMTVHGLGGVSASGTRATQTETDSILLIALAPIRGDRAVLWLRRRYVIIRADGFGLLLRVGAYPPERPWVDEPNLPPADWTLCVNL